MQKALFWDFHGTLIYSDIGDMVWTNALHRALSKQGYSISPQEIGARLHEGFTWYRPESAYPSQTGAAWWEGLFQFLCPFYTAHNVVERDMLSANRALREAVLDKRNYVLYPDAEATLRACAEKGYKNYILSNNFPELPDVIQDMGLAGYFAGYIVSANVGFEKPRIEIFEYALRVAGNPAMCVMIGDNPVSDIKGGKGAGMKTIMVHQQTPSEADFSCETLSQITDLLK